jgi:xanthine dehydrogenase accessory factor
VIGHLPWHEALREAIGRGERAMVVAVAGAAGSTPRESGAAMIVTRDRIAGTVGGGHLEYEAMRIAREALAADAMTPAHWLVRFPLAARLGQCCGGVATLAFATVDAGAAAWLDAVAACARASEAFAVIGRLGSGESAAKRLVVTADDARGTLGETGLDSAAVAEARARLAGRRGAGAASGAVDLAGAQLFVHVVRPIAFPVCVFGNGHVGRALVQVLGALPAVVRWIDTREHDFPASVPGNVEVVVTDSPAAEIDDAPRGAYVVVMTHSHALDFDIVEAALSRDDWRYLGLIGSRAKRAQFERRLEARGLAPASLARVTCPIGRGYLRSKEPGAIAVAVAAELLAVREGVGHVAHPESAAPGVRRGPPTTG